MTHCWRMHNCTTALRMADLSKEAINVSLAPFIHLLHKLPQAFYVVCRQGDILGGNDDHICYCATHVLFYAVSLQQLQIIRLT